MDFHPLLPPLTQENLVQYFDLYEEMQHEFSLILKQKNEEEKKLTTRRRRGKYRKRCRKVNLTCEICDKKYLYKQSLEDHVNAEHHKYKYYACSQCGQLFSFRKQVYRHQKLSKHSGGIERLGKIDFL